MSHTFSFLWTSNVCLNGERLLLHACQILGMNSILMQVFEELHLCVVSYKKVSAFFFLSLSHFLNLVGEHFFYWRSCKPTYKHIEIHRWLYVYFRSLRLMMSTGKVLLNYKCISLSLSCFNFIWKAEHV